MKPHGHALNRRCFTCGLIVTATVPILSSFAQGSARPFCGFSADAGWGDVGPKEFITRQARQNDSSNIPQVVLRIMETLSFNVDFDVLIAEGRNNAYATVAGGRKILVVDVAFMASLNRKVGTDWAAISVIAHEVGHHIAGFSDDRHRSELNADYWSGQALQRLGSGRDSALRLILSEGADQDTLSHPNKKRRAESVARGWDDASQGRINFSFCDGCRRQG